MKTTKKSRATLLLALLFAFAGLGVFRAAAEPVIYATAGAGKSLVKIDVGTQKVTTVGDFGVPGADAIAINAKGEAFAATHGWPPGGDSQLARVDLATGKATPFGATLTPENFMGLGFAPDGTLYGVNAASGTPDSGSLYKFDLTSGAATKVGTTGGCFDIMDLAWAPDGTMYGVANDSLYRVDATTGQTTLMTKLQGVSRVMGLAIDDLGRFYVSEIVTNAPVLRVDPVTGNTAKLLSTGADLVHGLDILPSPAIRASSSFQNTAVFSDKGVRFTVNATGIAPLTYQWRKNDQELPGQTNNTLVIASAQPADEGDYTIQVSNSGGTVVSPPARLWVVPPATAFRKSDLTNSSGGRLPFFYYLPEAYDPAQRYPMVFNLHGLGWYESLLPSGFAAWPEVLVPASYKSQLTDPAIIVYPTHRSQDGAISWTDKEVMLIAEQFDQLLAAFSVDTNRIYLTGISSGGVPAVQLVAKRPELFAAAVIRGTDPVPKALISAVKHVPFWIFEASAEGSNGRQFAANLRSANGHPVLSVYASGDHSTAIRAGMACPALNDWLLAQRRGQLLPPTVAISGPTTNSVYSTGATQIGLTGSVTGAPSPVSRVEWSDQTLHKNGKAAGIDWWTAGEISLAVDQTNVIVITATMDTTWAPALGGTTTFSDTLVVLNSPVRASLSLQSGTLVLNWTGGVPPFSVQRTPALGTGIPGWTEIATGVRPPVSVPAQTSAEFYRVVGQ